jgi:hypothetical protein
METARDIASDYCDTPVGSLPHHKIAKHVTGAKEFDELPTTSENGIKLAGLVLLWLMMEHVCGPLTEKRIALFSDNSPIVSWVEQIACRSSLVTEQLICVLALRFNIQKVCPITTLHIAGDQNSMTDIPSRSFGSEHKWHFKSEHDLLTFFNVNFTLPLQNSWTVCQPTSTIATRVISVLRMTPFTLDDWRRLPAAGENIGTTGKSTSQHAKVDLKLLIISVIPIYSLSDTINLFCFLFFILINKLITFSAS